METIIRTKKTVVWHYIEKQAHSLSMKYRRYIGIFYTAGWGPALAGLATLLGHCFPVFIGFKGGRGVLTAAGVIVVLSPLAFVIALIITISTILISRYVSLGSIAGSLTSIIC